MAWDTDISDTAMDTRCMDMDIPVTGMAVDMLSMQIAAMYTEHVHRGAADTTTLSTTPGQPALRAVLQVDLVAAV